MNAVRRVLTRLRRRHVDTNPGSVILMYHRVADVSVDPWDLCVTPDHFDEQMSVLARRSPVSLAELLDGAPPRTVVVTVDDAYVDTVEVALPAMERYGVPTTVYVTSQGLSGSRVCWWDELADLVLGGGDGLAEGLENEHLALWSELISCPPDEQARRIRALERRFGRPAAPSARLLDAEGVHRLASSPMVTIGAHTVHHSPLPELAAPARRAEILGSVRELGEITGAPIRDFAYPYGRYDDDTVSDVMRAGFERAVTTDHGLVCAGGDRLRLPRVQVPDLDGDEFSTWLDETLSPGTNP